MKKFVDFIVHRYIHEPEKTHDQDVRSQIGWLEGWVSIIANLILTLIKGVLGFITGSVALIADALHTFSDVSTSVVIVIAFRVAKKPSDRTHPFGHGRMEAIGSVIVAVLLIVIGIEILKESIERLVHPVHFEASWLFIGIITGTIIIKELLARFSHELGQHIKSSTLEADAWHHRTDAISSILVVLAFLVQRYFGIAYIDSIAGILVSAIIAYTGWVIIKSGVNDLLGKRPSACFVKEIKETVCRNPDVLDAHDLIVHQYGQHTVMSFHVEVTEDTSLQDAHALTEKIEKMVERTFDSHATIHVDPVNVNDPELKEIRKSLKNVLKKRKEKISFHDLRSVGDTASKNIVFDLVADPDMSDRAVEHLRDDLVKQLLEKFPSAKNVIIEVEPKYAL